MKADFIRAAEYADLADRELHFAERMASAARFVDTGDDVVMRYRESELYYRVQAGQYRLLEKLALRGDA